MARPSWFIKALIKSFPQRFTFAKFTNVPLVGRLIEFMAFENDRIYYLAKDSTIKTDKQKTKAINKKVITVNKTFSPQDEVLPSDIVKHYINKSNCHWIMNFCICRHSSGCENYSSKLGCLFLGEASINIDSDLGRKVTKQEALEHIDKCKEEGLIHLIGRNKLDTVWLDIKPGNKLMTICNCCECCCLWKMLPNTSPQIQDKITKMPGVTVSVTEECIGCKSCEEVCFVDALSYEDNKATISDMCRGCGRCVEHCPNNAIELTIKSLNYTEEIIVKLDELVDVK